MNRPAWKKLRLTACSVAFSVWGIASAVAQPFTPIEGEGLSDRAGRKVSIDELPPCPPALTEILDRSNVTFRVGGLRPSIIRPSRSTGSVDQKFDAETQFRLRYSFNSRCRWKMVGDRPRRRMKVDVTFDQIELVVEHTVWLRSLPPIESFWRSPLVLHEFDHLRLSSDRRLKALFERKVRSHQSTVLSEAETRQLLEDDGVSSVSRLSLSSRVGGDHAKSWVGSVVQKEFDSVVELVEIRYAELDRVTQHGLRPVPVESELASWLTQDADE